MVESGVGEEEGGVSFCEIEYDSQDIMDSGLGLTYMITSMPTLLSFDRGEAQTGTKVIDPKQIKDSNIEDCECFLQFGFWRLSTLCQSYCLENFG